jgi:hypothetical protein
MKTNTIRGASFLLLFIFFFFITNAQNYFSKRIAISGKANQAGKVLFIKDTFYIPTSVFEVSFNSVSASLIKITNTGNLFSAKRFKPINRSFNGGSDALLFNGKVYTAGITDWGLQVQQGLYTFNQNSDTIYTRSYGDTVYYNYNSKILPFLKTKNKLIMFGITDSTCGVNHPGLYKPCIRVVDTNGVLYQTKLFTTTNYYRSLWDADTTTKKGFIFCGAEVVGTATKNYVIKLDSNLNQQWNKFIDTGNSLFSSIISLKKGGILFANNHTDSIQNNTYFWDRITLTRLDINGNIIWRKRYGNAEKDISVSRVKECSNGDFILCGQKYINYTSIVNQLVGWLMRTDSLGNVKWWKSYLPNNPIKDTITQNYLYDVLELPNKDIASVGNVGGSSTFSTIVQTWLLKVDSNGCFGIGNCAQNIALSINDHNTQTKIDVNNVNIFPNPANSELNIELLALNNPNYNLLITNAIGQTVHQTSLNNQRSIVNISEFPQGIYFVTIKTGKATLTKKVVIEH